MSKEEKKDFKYDAFISYRHAPLDMYVAQTLQKELESFKVPGLANKDIKELGKDGIKRIFRDKDELPLAGNLSEPITYALENSEYLIVICSPRTPESMWVQREIQTFAELRGIENIFAVLIEGEPRDAFPEQLTCIEREVTLPDGTTEKQKLKVEPLAADVRGNTKAIVHKNIKREILRLAAPMLGCSYDDLKQRHKMRKLKRLLVSCSIAGAICLGFGTFSTIQAIRIQQQAKELEVKNNKNLELQSKSLSAKALDLYDQGNKIDGLLVSLAGLPQNPDKPVRPVTADSIHALSKILQVYNNHTDFLPYQVLEHDTRCNKSVMSGDGTKIITIDSLSQLYSWDMETGKLLAKVQISDGIASENLFASGENQVVYGNSEGVTCYNTENLDVIWSTDNDSNGVLFMSLSADQSRLAYSDAQKIHVLKMEDGSEMSSWTLPDSLYASGYNMTFSEDGKYLLYQEPPKPDGTGIVAVTDVTNGTIKCEYSMKYQTLQAVLYTNNGECYLASRSDDEITEKGFCAKQAIDCYNADGTLKWERTGMSSVGAPLRLYNDWLVYPDGDSVYMVSQATGEIQKEYHYAARVTKYVASAESDTLVACLSDGTIINTLVSSDDDMSVVFLEPADESIEMMFRNRDLIVRVPGASSNIYVYKNVTGSKMEDMGELETGDFTGQITSDGSRMVGFGSNSMQIYDLENKKIISNEEYEEYILGGSLVDDDKLLLVLSDSILLYDLKSGEVINSISEDICSQYIDKKNNKLTICTVKNDFVTYQTGDLKEISRLKDGPYISKFISLEDGKELIATNYDKNGIMLDPESGKTEELPWCSDFIAGSCDGTSYLAADNKSKTVSLYKGDSKEPVQTVECKTSFLKDISFSSDGTKFLILLQNGHMEVYDTETFERLKVFENMINIDNLEDKGELQILYNSRYNDKAYILNNDMEMLYEIPDYQGITDDATRIFTTDHNILMSAPVYDLKMLLDEADKVLDGRSLNAEKAVQYYVQ